MKFEDIISALEHCGKEGEILRCGSCPLFSEAIRDEEILGPCKRMYLEAARQLRTQQATIRSLLKATEYHRQMNGALLKAVDELTEASAFRED